MTAPYRDSLDHLADELRRLDLLIGLRLDTATLVNEAVPEGQAGRTVYIGREEVDWLLAGGAEAVRDGADTQQRHDRLHELSAEIDARVAASLAAGTRLPLPTLGRLFGLSPWELEAVVVCLAPELRRRYDRLYAYLQDDITRKRPSVDLILDLLCHHERQRWAAREALTGTAVLLRLEILRPVDDPDSPSGSSGLARFLRVDPRVLGYLLEDDAMDARLSGAVQVLAPARSPDADETAAASLTRLARLWLSAGADRRPLIFALHGPDVADARELAGQVCADLGVGLLTLDLAMASGPEQGAQLIRTAFREALLRQAAVCVTGADALPADGAHPVLGALAVALNELGSQVFLAGRVPWPADAFGDAYPRLIVRSVALTLPEVPRATGIWIRALAGYPDAAEVEAWAAELAGRFRLPAGRIRTAVESARARRAMSGEPGDPTLADLAAACRAQSSQRLGDLAVKVVPTVGWDDLVLPSDRIEQLRDICVQARYHYQVFGGWGFGEKLSRGRGLSALFSGLPGTGKTMAAEVLAADLAIDLYKVDLSGVVSKYIGETEKNLSRIFDEAASSNAILFFDEADALFGKRTEVSDAHDRYANIETSYLLQRMEDYDGIVVLATNLRQNLDDAFTRRIRFVVEFPFPEADSRRQIWQTQFPARAPLADDVDFDALARDFAVAGGNIRNIVVNAAFLAAADGGVIGRRHILLGTRREYDKIGKLWSEPPALVTG